MKFSIIVPVYNVENYVLKCLESINKQTYKNFEVIIVNDGSVDNSKKIIKKYIKGKKKFYYYEKENGGLSDARNYGVHYAVGDYLLFVDSDDFVSNKLLEKLEKEISKNQPQIIKFGCKLINDDKKYYKNAVFSCLNFDDAINYLIKDDALEPAWLYCYQKEFWLKNKFMYAKGRIHEDFGLTPLVLLNANKISSIKYLGYNYVIRENSIMTSKTEEKDYKKFIDKLYFFDINIPVIEKSKININSKKILNSFYANNIIYTTKSLSKSNRRKAAKEIKIRHLEKYLLDDNFKRKVKKILYKFNCIIYINFWNKFV